MEDFKKIVLHNENLTEHCSSFPRQPQNEVFRESIIRHLSQMFSPERQIRLFGGVLSLLEMIRRIGDVLNETASSSIDLSQFSYPIELSNLLKFSVGQRDEALSTIKSWLAQNVINYVKIYDPYFDENELEILKAIPQQTRVTVLTSLKGNNSKTNIEDIATKYRSS